MRIHKQNPMLSCLGGLCGIESIEGRGQQNTKSAIFVGFRKIGSDGIPKDIIEEDSWKILFRDLDHNKIWDPRYSGYIPIFVDTQGNFIKVKLEEIMPGDSSLPHLATDANTGKALSIVIPPSFPPIKGFAVDDYLNAITSQKVTPQNIVALWNKFASEDSGKSTWIDSSKEYTPGGVILIGPWIPFPAGRAPIALLSFMGPFEDYAPNSEIQKVHIKQSPITQQKARKTNQKSQVDQQKAIIEVRQQQEPSEAKKKLARGSGYSLVFWLLAGLSVAGVVYFGYKKLKD